MVAIQVHVIIIQQFDVDLFKKCIVALLTLLIQIYLFMIVRLRQVIMVVVVGNDEVCFCTAKNHNT